MRRSCFLSSMFFAASLAMMACSREGASQEVKLEKAAAPNAAASSLVAATAAPSVVATSVVGKPAPDFTLKDLAGHDVSLASFRGKVVVLEWFNPGCPFVKASHTKGSLRATAKKHVAEGVVWLAINSAAPGKQGSDPAANSEATKTFDLNHPILRDENGAVGHAYGATNTPNMFIVDKNGVVVYGGAIDNSPDGEGEAPTSGALVNYVDAALEDLATGKPVRTPVTKPYGCSVKYGS